MTTPTTLDTSTPQLMNVPIGSLKIDEQNVRRQLGNIDELATSIAVDGILSPLLVMPIDAEPGTFRIIAGHRRLAAALKAGLKEVPVQVRSSSDAHARYLQLIENIERANLSAIEIAERLQQFVEMEGGDDAIERVAERTHREAPWVRRHLALLKLEPKVVRAIQRNNLGISMAAEVAKIARRGDVEAAIATAAAIKSGEVNRASLRSGAKQSPASVTIKGAIASARFSFVDGFQLTAAAEQRLRDQFAAIDALLGGGK